MIEIRITSPHNMDSDELIALADYLKNIAVKPKKIENTEGSPNEKIDYAIVLPIEESEIISKGTPDQSEADSSASGIDSAGFPWDARIHSRTKTLGSGGRWKYQRGVSRKLIEEVETELKPAPLAEEGKVFTGTEQAPSIFGKSKLIPPVPPVSVPDSMGFPQFMEEATNLANTGQIDFRRIIEIVQSNGLPNIASVSIRPDMIPQLLKQIHAEIAGAA